MYKTIIFDMDDTLIDEAENMKCAFKEVMKYIQKDYSDSEFLKFQEIDKKTWKDRAEGRLITPFEENNDKKAEWLRAYRFLKFFEEKISYEEAVNINNIYMNALKEKVVPKEGSTETIKYLHEKGYHMIIATNGAKVAIASKMEKLKIKEYINVVLSGEEIGAMKPHIEFYEELFKRAKIEQKEKVLFIGDELVTDIQGGINAGIDTCWYNARGEEATQIKPKYEIHQLIKLKEIL